MAPTCLWMLLANSAARAPEAVAVMHGERELSYGALASEVDRLAGHLAAPAATRPAAGVRREARVGVLSERSLEQVLAILAIARCGGAFVVLSPQLKADQLRHIIDDAGIQLVLTTPGQLSTLREISALAAERAPLEALLIDTLGQRDDDVQESDQGEDAPPRWSALRRTAPAAPVLERPILADDLATIIYTSGSTGRPKGVVLPQRNVVEGAEIVSGYLGITSRDRLLGALALNFDYGLNQLTCALLQGAMLVLHDFFMPRDLIALLDRERITVFAGLRPIWLTLLRGRFALDVEAGDIPELPALRLLTNTGGKVPLAIVEELQRAFPSAELVLMYGLTEAFRSTYLPSEELKRRPTSMGKAIPGVEILVVDDEGREVAPGVEGELVHRGALVSRGYWNAPEATARVFGNNPRYGDQPHLGERVVYSGDRVVRDEEGFLYFVGRRDALIKSAGHRVSPQEIEEAVLTTCCAASQAVVFGLEHDERDTEILCVVEADPAAVDGKALRRQLRSKLPGHMLPAKIIVERELPRTASGKIDRARVSARHRSV